MSCAGMRLGRPVTMPEKERQRERERECVSGGADIKYNKIQRQ